MVFPQWRLENLATRRRLPFGTWAVDLSEKASSKAYSNFGSESRSMAVPRLVFWVTFCGCVLLCVASPTRRQFGSLTETTSSDPAAAVTDGGAVWDDTDDFDLDGDKDWLSEIVISPSSIPQQSEYEDYDDDDDDDDYAPRRSNPVVDLGDDDDDDDVEHQDAEEDSNANQAEFLFVPSKDNRFMLQDDDDDQSGPIKVRHTGKNSYTEVLGSDNSEEDASDSNRQFEFTIDNGDEDDDKENEVDDDTGDFVLDDKPHKGSSNSVEVLPRQELHDEDSDDEDDDDNFVADGDTNGDPMFESPEEDSQVIYGDHVFMY